MRITVSLCALLLSIPGGAAAQEWEVYTSQQDHFSVNFPGRPQITETEWQSQLGYTLPARDYSAYRGRARFSLKVIDYSSLEQQGIARWQRCPSGNSQCRDGGETIGPGYWKQDERGAMVYAVSTYLKRPFEVTDYAWDWQDMVEGHGLQLKSEGTRTFVHIAMHKRKLYILEASAPEEEPEPGLFTQSLRWVDKNGKRIRYTEIIYSNSYHGLGVYPEPKYQPRELE